MNNLSWKNRLILMKPNEKIGASLRWSDNEHNLIKKLNRFKKLGYLKSLGCVGSEVMYMRTNKPVNERHFTKIKNLKIKKMEKIEELAEKFYSEQSESYENAIEPTFDNSRYLVTGFIDGAKWQQEHDKNKYSEEEVLNIIKARENYLNNTPKNSLYIPIKQWFSQFKNQNNER